jgi:hypothetical protein
LRSAAADPNLLVAGEKPRAVNQTDGGSCSNQLQNPAARNVIAHVDRK